MKVSNKIKKPWGFEDILETNKNYTVKRLFLKNGYQCSYQYHEFKKETIYSLSGELTIILQDRKIKLLPGKSFTINPLALHRMKAETGDCLYLECSTSELDDVVRVEDDYGRRETKKSDK